MKRTSANETYPTANESDAAAKETDAAANETNAAANETDAIDAEPASNLQNWRPNCKTDAKAEEINVEAR